MQEVKLETIKEGKVSIELKKKGMSKRLFYNLDFLPGDKASSLTTNAYMQYDFNKEKIKNAKYIIAAVLYDHNTASYETAWNIMNLLGAHEYTGHAIRGYTGDDGTHYMAYLYQMGHASWKHTTKQYRKGIRDSYNSYIEQNETWNVPRSDYSKELDRRKRLGIYPNPSENMDTFIGNASKKVQKKSYFENNLRDYRWKGWNEKHNKTF